MSKNNLEKRAHKEFYKRPTKPLQCDKNSNPCASYETSYCNLSCPYAQKQKQEELALRKRKSTYIKEF